MYTDYHSQYWAHALMLKSASDSIANLSRSISNAKVDLNPHQVDAALFAFRSPLTKGSILADEVGLGKTIEAGIVIAQKWAERRRKILLILPATLRNQWQLELEEKFFLPSVVLESKNFNLMRKAGNLNPFDQNDCIVACSYHFAASRSTELKNVPWDLVVIDEAHRMRNVYKPKNKLAKKITKAVSHAPKLLLTATPLQNSLLELFGLVSVIDPHVFGNLASFREQFVRTSDIEGRDLVLRQRIERICTRTLRKQVLEYIKYTNRVPITQEFLPSDDEHLLYEQVSTYLRRKLLQALPSSQRALMTLVLRKLLASSTFAISATLHRLVNRLEAMLRDHEQKQSLQKAKDADPIVELSEDYETLDELSDEWDPDKTDNDPINPELVRDELSELRQYAELAERIRHNAKGDALLGALRTAFDRAHELGAKKKAVIFTESRRTQDYLFKLLSANGYRDRVVLMNGSNSDPHSRATYQNWLKRHEGQSVVTGLKAVDTKAAIVEEFRDRATIMIATEAGAEGINLQFCSLVVNYDLPWNPQRVEQRIGRCHRYGQQHDVVVVNFLNQRNQADQRVFELLAEKFQLFDGVFGASDEVLGALESGVDIERRIARVYQECRTSEEITGAFDQLQAELEEQVQTRLAETRQILLENFDQEVHDRLKVHRKQAFASLGNRERWLLSLTQHELGDQATFDPTRPTFFYTGSDARQGNYSLDWRRADQKGDMFYRADHPLAQLLIARSLQRQLDSAHVEFDYQTHGARIAVLEKFLGASGWLEVSRLQVETFEREEFLLLAGQTDSGKSLDGDRCRKLIELPGRLVSNTDSQEPNQSLETLRDKEIAKCVQEVNRRNADLFDEEVDKLDRWSDDVKLSLETEIKELDREIREARKTAALAASLNDKLAAQKTIKSLEKTRKDRRKRLFDSQDEVDAKRDQLIARIEGQLSQRQTWAPLFLIRWTLKG